MITVERVLGHTGKRCSWCDGDVAPPVLTMAGVNVRAAVCRQCAVKLVNALVFMVATVTGQSIRKLVGLTSSKPRSRRGGI